MANLSQSGIFYHSHGGLPIQDFPSEYRRGLFSRIDSRFTILFIALLFFSSTLVLTLSFVLKEKTVVSDAEIMKIQERYAELVMNQPKPVVKEEVQTTSPVVQETGSTEGTQEGTEEQQVDRSKETFAEKEQRKVASSAQRAAVREAVAAQVRSSGIFAAITAAGSSGGGGGGGGVSDLLGAGGGDAGLAGLGSVSISKGTFATRTVDANELVTKRGTRTTDVGIQTQGVASTRVGMSQVASTGTVNITSAAPPAITGESASQPDRSQAAIQKVVDRERLRLKRVYEDWLKRDPALSGRLTIKFTILPSGSVSNVAIVKSSTNNTEFDDTVVRYIKRWQFPPVSGGGEVEVVYPFVFEGQA